MTRDKAVGSPGQASGGVRYLRQKLLVLLGLCLIPGMGAASMAWTGRSWLPLALYPLASLGCLLLYWQDKRQARAQAWRTPEKVLHVAELVGGWPGALLAQQLFRHKTRKVAYQVVFWLIVVLHQAFWIYSLWFSGSAGAWH
ncbi:DUF1294 domain-containing protein [Pseudomonas sp. S75]|uniref:DUF1294 domain-containing protein n=1 Tax=unclassified Pseudomonas TaxID=196821 RepID=UPI0019055F32|nr:MULTISPECIES: DUF1294 domain-containing protein [unclassified Pseudomonas]MBJ9976456.1 DUF1294 domain-containing protein [Pseudomonas sp. S30]MBK0155644.1 DUF1294 domain-containing protein [Pseudomonas sp. S75]